MNKAISDRKLDALLTMSVDAIVEKNAESFLEQDYEIVPMPNSLRRKYSEWIAAHVGRMSLVR